MLRAEADFLTVQRRLVEMYDTYSGAVVRVKASFEEEAEDGTRSASLRVGSGFFISRDGHILTNASVAHQADRVWFEFRGGSYMAEIVGDDPETNVSLLRAVKLPEDFQTVSLTALNREPAVGTIVVGITQPLDLEPGPVFGLLSGKDGQFAQRIFPTYYHRVSIPAYPGEGGSPVFSLDGRLLGMIVASLPEIRSSYLLPVEAMIRVRDEILEEGKVVYSWIGVDLEEFSTVEEGSRVRVTEVVEDGPGDRMGLRKGDVLKELGGFATHTLGDVRQALFFYSAGSFLEVRWARNGEVLEKTLQTVARPKLDGEEEESASEPATPEVAETPGD